MSTHVYHLKHIGQGMDVGLDHGLKVNVPINQRGFRVYLYGYVYLLKANCSHFLATGALIEARKFQLYLSIPTTDLGHQSSSSIERQTSWFQSG